jgi:hypothetical protein
VDEVNGYTDVHRVALMGYNCSSTSIRITALMCLFRQASVCPQFLDAGTHLMPRPVAACSGQKKGAFVFVKHAISL